jgi:hypothetical protein
MHISRLQNRCRATPQPKICAQVFYPHNEKTKVVGQSFGNHGGDWEHITVRSTQEGEMLSIYFAAHGSDEGVWVAASNVHFDARGKSNRPVVFVAKAGHGSYPKQGSWSRKEGPERTFNADDDADSPGRTWAPIRAVIVTGGGSASESTVVSIIPEDASAGASAYLPASFKRDVQATAELGIGPPDVIIRPSPWVNWDCYWGRGTYSEPEDEKFFGQEKAGKNPTSPQRQGWYSKVEGPSFERDTGDEATFTR